MLRNIQVHTSGEAVEVADDDEEGSSTAAVLAESEAVADSQPDSSAVAPIDALTGACNPKKWNLDPVMKLGPDRCTDWFGQ